MDTMNRKTVDGQQSQNSEETNANVGTTSKNCESKSDAIVRRKSSHSQRRRQILALALFVTPHLIAFALLAKLFFMVLASKS